jgi:hypothetical protein
MGLDYNDYLKSYLKNKTQRTLKLDPIDLHCDDEIKSESNKGDKTWSTLQLDQTDL